MKAFTLLYGTVTYLLFFGTFLFLIGWSTNLVVPLTIDGGEVGGLWPSLLINLALVVAFGVQHSIMARPGFKKRWTKIIPEAIERSTFVLVTVGMFALYFFFWQPLPDVVWSVDNQIGAGVLWGISALGWLVVLLSTFWIGHFELFGLAQVWRFATGKEAAPPRFRTPGLYQRVRHPIMTGFLIAFWCQPHMSVGKLQFALLITSYVLFALTLEERDLKTTFGWHYERYIQRVPKLIPSFGRRLVARSEEEREAAASRTA